MALDQSIVSHQWRLSMYNLKNEYTTKKYTKPLFFSFAFI